MRTRVALFGTVSALTLACAACDQIKWPDWSAVWHNIKTSWQAPPKSQTAEATPADIGKPLYAAAEYPAPEASHTGADPVVIPQAHVTVVERQEVPSQNDGKLEFIGTEIAPGEQVPADRLIVHNGKKYRRLREGDVVRAGQLVGLLDDRRARAEFEAATQAVVASEGALQAAGQILLAAKAIADQERELAKRGAGVKRELIQAEAGVQQKEGEIVEKRGLLEKAKSEVIKADVVLKLHEIHATIPGVIREIYRRPGEAVKALEPILKIENLSNQRVEALVPIQDQWKLKLGQEVLVEPSRSEGPARVFIGHTQPVTAIAVSKDSQTIVSASEDRTVRIWTRAGQQRILPHPVAVRAVTCTAPSAATNYCLSGADDGKLRLWDLDAGNEKPLREFAGSHDGVIHAVALSPDGQFAASSDDRDICLWDVATGERKYRFPQEHRGAIAVLQFTPQGTLISAARDGTLRVWKLGQQGAEQLIKSDRRSNEVTKLGVRADGGQVLFDQGQSLQVLTLPDWRVAGELKNPAGEARFNTFAMFSPDGQLILTAATDGQMQLWRAPAASRGWASEVRELVPPAGTGAAVDAAFSPSGDYLVTGTQDRKVMVWAVPKADAEKPMTARITLIDNAVEASGRLVRVWATLMSGDAQLMTRSSVTVIAQPESQVSQR